MSRSLLLGGLLLCCARLFAFDVMTQVQHATCGTSLGSASSYASGGTWPFTFLWSTGATTSYITDVPPGTYSITITDANNETGTAEIEILSLPGLDVPTGPFDMWSCEEPCSGYLNFYASDIGGAAPYTVTFDPPGPSGYAGQSYIQIYGLCAGNSYNVTVEDANGCSGQLGPINVSDPVYAMIISSSATPSCPNGHNGSFTVEYDQFDSLYVNGPGFNYYQPTTNPFTLANLPPGEYVLHATLISDNLPPNVYGSACYHTDTLIVPESTDPCGSINGHLFADVDGDCAQSTSEPDLTQRILAVEPGGNYVMSDVDGAFATDLYYGDYTLDAPFTDYASNCTSLPAAFTLDAGNTSASFDLPLQPTFGPDVAMYFWMGWHVPGFTSVYAMSVNNMGPYSFTDLTVDLYYDPLLIYSNATLTPSLIEPGHLQWTIASFGPFDYENIHVYLQVPADPGLIGTQVEATATVTPTVPDDVPENNSVTWQRTITSSWDPNEKLVTTSSRSSNTSYYLDADQFVDYTVHFQNTGTSPAVNVDVLDTISDLMDLTSFTFVGASHNYEVELLPGRVLRFHFPYIMLPDSGADMSGSQGFVAFRLRPVASITPGMVLSNAADIFFDFNEPVRTNDADLLVEQSQGMVPHTEDELHAYPNPVSDMLWLEVPVSTQRLEVYAMDGRNIRSMRAATGRQSIDVHDLKPGIYELRTIDAAGIALNLRFVKR